MSTSTVPDIAARSRPACPAAYVMAGRLVSHRRKIVSTPSPVSSRSATVLDPGRNALLEADRHRAVQSAYVSQLLAHARAASSALISLVQ
jgi:hypothetical protein